jgi:hypothetical protein
MIFSIAIYTYYNKSHSKIRDGDEIFNSSMQNEIFSFSKIKNKTPRNRSINNNKYIWYSK